MATSPLGPGAISLRDFIEAVGSADTAHGAVSTAAVAGGLGSSLLLMVAALPQTRSDSVADRATLAEAAAALTALRQQLIETIETETAVKIFTARNMPQASAAQRSERQEAIQLALRASAEVPLEIMRLCAQGLELAAAVASHGTRAASADLQLGVALLHAGFDGARSNLDGKLSSFIDAAYITSIVDEIGRLTGEATASTRAAESLLKAPPALSVGEVGRPLDVRSRILKTTALAAVAGAMWTQMPQLSLRLRRLSLRCCGTRPDAWRRRSPDRLYLECLECGRQTPGWLTKSHPVHRSGGPSAGA